jgi:hypothetical protein
MGDMYRVRVFQSIMVDGILLIQSILRMIEYFPKSNKVLIVESSISSTVEKWIDYRHFHGTTRITEFTIWRRRTSSPLPPSK